MNIDELKALIDLCTAKKVRQLEANGIMICLDDTAFQSESDAAVPGMGLPNPTIEMPNDEEMLYHSTDLVKLDEPKN